MKVTVGAIRQLVREATADRRPVIKVGDTVRERRTGSGDWIVMEIVRDAAKLAMKTASGKPDVSVTSWVSVDRLVKVKTRT